MKRDPEATAAAKFLDKRSYVSLDGHEFLFGPDMEKRRYEVIERDHQHCVLCGWLASHDFGEIDHIKKRSQGGCECLHNLQTLCARCHRGAKGKHG
jgi:hypothetical protein